MARPTKLTPEMHEKLVQAVKSSAFRETAAAFVGIDPKTFRNWLKKAADGGEENEPYVRLAADIEQAEAESEIQDLNTITAAAKGTDKLPPDWRAAAWRLARKYPQRYSELRKLEHSGEIETKPAGVVILPEEDDAGTGGESEQPARDSD